METQKRGNRIGITTERKGLRRNAIEITLSKLILTLEIKIAKMTPQP
jgi:hypothetical protein